MGFNEIYFMVECLKSVEAINECFDISLNTDIDIMFG